MQAAIAPTRMLLRISGLVLAPIAIVASIAGCGSKDPVRPPASTQAPFQPPVGTYSYATSGQERADLLLGVRNRYPALTRVRVTRRPCGYSERWIANQGRWMQLDYCVGTDGSRRLEGLIDFHEFLGYPVTLSYRCEGASIPNLARVRRGFSWTDRCTARTTSLVLHGSVAGRKRIEVDGVTFDAVRLRVVARMRGRNEGRISSDYWLSARDGLLLRRTVAGNAKTKTPVGKVVSRERFRLSLRSPDRRSQQASTGNGA